MAQVSTQPAYADIVNKFATAVGSGREMTRHFARAVEYVRETNDSTPIVRIVQRAIKRGDQKTAALVRNAFCKIYEGAKPNVKKGAGLVGIKIADATISNWHWDALQMLVEDKVSMRGKKFNDAFKSETESAPFDPIKWAERQHKNNPAQLEAMIAALQARRG